MGRILVVGSSNSMESSTLLLPENLAVAGIGELRKSLCKALRPSGEVTLDPTSIKTADAASLQLLAAFVNRAKAMNMAVNWTGFSAELTTAATLLGLRRHLGLQAGERSS